MSEELGWLLERVINSRTHYFSAAIQSETPTDWTKDHQQALRFARWEDAKQFANSRVGCKCDPVEHMWIN